MEKNVISNDFSQISGEIFSKQNPYTDLQDLEVMLEDYKPEELQQKIEKIHHFFKTEGLEGIFGVMLLHKHFDIHDDEMLLEEIDMRNRRQVVQPIRKDELRKIDGELVQTTWKFTQQDVICIGLCLGNNGHRRTHEEVEMDDAPEYRKR